MAGNRVISAVLTLKDKDFSSGVKKANSATKDLERKVKSTGNSVRKFGRSATDSFKRVATGVVGMAAAIGGINLGVSMVESAASAQAVNAQFEQVFGNIQSQAQKTVDELGESFGMVSERLKPAYTQMTSMFQGLGMSTEESMKQAETAVTLAADAAAFYDKSYEDANSALNSFIKGNYEGGESIGLFASETQMASWASRELGIDWKNLDEAGKQVARLQFAESMQDAAGAIGQAARESDSYENQLGNLRQTWDNLKAKLGEPILEPAVQGLKTLATWVGNIDTDKIINGFINAGTSIKDNLVGAYTAVKPGIDWIKDTGLPATRDAIGFVVTKATELYNFISSNWSLIGPVVAGVAASVAAFKVGIIAVTAAQNIWRGVTTGVQIATALLNGTLAISPLGWVAIAIGAVVAAGIALWKNWDTVKAAAQSLWDKLKTVWTAIEDGFANAWEAVKGAAETAINGVISGINVLIETINKIPGVNVPIVAKVDWTEAEVPEGGKAVSASYAVGTNRVPRDMVAQIHKDEMIIPARQSERLRQQGMTIDNIDQLGENTTTIASVTPRQEIVNTQSNSDADLKALIQLLKQFLSQYRPGDTVIKVDARDKSITEIMNELIPILKHRLANL